MCPLFGGFPDSYFAACDEAWPPLPGRDERLPLLQLYHLLNHLNLFGEGMGDRWTRCWGGMWGRASCSRHSGIGDDPLAHASLQEMQMIK